MKLSERYDIATKKMPSKNKAQAWKFIGSLADENVYDENFSYLEGVDIYPTSGRDFVIYGIEPRTLAHYIDLAKQMDFENDIRRKPRRLSRSSMAGVIKRMGQCDAARVPYKDEKTGLTANFIFDKAEFEKSVEPLLKDTMANKPVAEEVVNIMDYNPTMEENTPVNPNASQIKEHASKLLDIFSLTDPADRDALMAAIDRIDATQLSEKEVLMAAFTDIFQVANLEILTTEIDSVLEQDKGRVLQLDDEASQERKVA